MVRKTPPGDSPQRFDGVVLSGHKQHAVEVPFDPKQCWGRDSAPFRAGRRGWPVQVVCRRFSFESHVVARSRRFWLLLDDDVLDRLKLEAGATIRVLMTPSA